MEILRVEIPWGDDKIKVVVDTERCIGEIDINKFKSELESELITFVSARAKFRKALSSAVDSVIDRIKMAVKNEVWATDEGRQWITEKVKETVGTVRVERRTLRSD